MNDNVCPSDDVLLALSAEDAESESARTHVQQCASCQERLRQVHAEIAALRGVTDGETRPMTGQTMRKTWDPLLRAPHADPAESSPEKFVAPGHESPSPLDSSQQQLGRFQLLHVVGKGGFGEVHLAYDPQLDRQVAIKIARRGVLDRKSEVDRFQREARSAAQLRHPLIIPVHDVGQSERINFIVYEFVEGETLRTVLQRRGRFAPQEAARLLSKLARGLHYAHQLGIVHRDVKPANIMIDSRGEPHIADFGLAYRDEDDGTQTREGVLMGTPAYMSPEQASGNAKLADARTDIWSLGVLLAELLTGERPFQGSVHELLAAIKDGNPHPLRSFDRTLPRDLEAICTKCLEKEPANRYPTAEGLADDLDRWCRGEPTSARPRGALSRGYLWARRNVTIASLIATVFCVLMIGIVASSYFAVRADQKARQVLREQQKRTEAQTDALRTAAPESVSLIVSDLERAGERVEPLLRDLLATESLTKKEQIRVRLALARVIAEELDPLLLAQLQKDLTTAEPAEFLLLLELLTPYEELLVPGLWMLALGEDTSEPSVQFRAACALARYDPLAASRWEQIAPDVVALLLTESPLVITRWITALRPVREALNPHLRAAFESAELGDRRVLASAVLAELFHESVPDLIELVAGAQAPQLSSLLPYVRARSVEAQPELLRILADGFTESDGAAPDTLAGHRANAGLALLYLGHGDAVWPWLGQAADKTVRTLMIHRMAAAGIDASLLVQRIEDETDPIRMGALILSLGEYGTEQLIPRQRRALAPKMLEIYREHPDAGVHAAIGWLLRRWGESERLKSMDESLASPAPAATRRWYVNGQGQTLTVIAGPVEFAMGAPEDEADRSYVEQQHRRRIPRSFAISTHEVTAEEFLRFRQQEFTKKYSPQPRAPMIDVTWYDAARYCRWLSEQEGVPDDQMCFPPLDEIGPEMSLREAQDRISRTGYRLPTAAEWEYASRGGAETTRHFSNAEAMLPYYAWYNANSENHAWPVGLLKPNDFGLFDVYGNALEWCQDLFFEDYAPANQAGVVVDGMDAREGFDIELRGGTFQDAPAYCRSAWRDFQLPLRRSYLFGFRVARTLDLHTDD